MTITGHKRAPCAPIKRFLQKTAIRTYIKIISHFFLAQVRLIIPRDCYRLADEPGAHLHAPLQGDQNNNLAKLVWFSARSKGSMKALISSHVRDSVAVSSQVESALHEFSRIVSIVVSWATRKKANTAVCSRRGAPNRRAFRCNSNLIASGQNSAHLPCIRHITKII